MSHEIARDWRLRGQRLRLEGEICKNCDSKIFPPRDICPECGHEADKKFVFSGKGTVESFTVIHEPPADFVEFAPYVMAFVRLKEGPLILAQLTDLDIKRGFGSTEVDQWKGRPPIKIPGVETTDFIVEIGMPVEMVTRVHKRDGESGLITYSYKFRPLINRSESVPQSLRDEKAASMSSK
jgi:uncharacterized OB-fold protein